MKSPRDQTPLGPPPDNQVPGVSNDKGHSTNALPDMVQQPQSKGHSTRGHSIRTRLSKGHSTHQLLGQDGSLDQRAAKQRTRAIEHGSLNSGSLDPHVSQHGSLNPSNAGTGSLDPGSLDRRAARPEARSAEQESLDSGSLNPHASQQGSLDPPVAATGSLDPGSLDPGSLDQRVASPRTSGSSVSILPQAPEAAGVAEYIVLAEAVAQVGIVPDGPADQHIPVAVATEAPPLSQSHQWSLQLPWRCPISVMTLHDHRNGVEGFRCAPRLGAVHLRDRRSGIQQLRLEALPT